MKVILTIKRNNKDANIFCEEIEITPHEYDNLKDIAIEVNRKAGQECLSAYIHQI